MQNYLKNQVDNFLYCVSYMTRLPVPFRAGVDLAGMMPYMPVVGAMVGLFAASVYYIVLLFFSHPVAVLFALAATVLFTGALHEDGFADVCDGIGGGYGREKILQIMKDPRTGSYGVTGLFFLLTGKFVILSEMESTSLWPVFLAAHVLSRWSSVFLAYVLPYVGAGRDKQGLGNLHIYQLLAASVFTVVVLYFIPSQALLPVILLVTAGLLFSYFLFKKYLRGITGDCLGAANQITEVMVYLGFAAHIPEIWKYIY